MPSTTNCTLPAGTGPVPLALPTVAVKETSWPLTDGFTRLATVVVVAAGVIVNWAVL